MNLYVRRKLKYHQRLSTPVEGLVYQHTPRDSAIGHADLLRAVRDYYQAHPDEGEYRLGHVEEAIFSLLHRGFIEEVVA